MIKVVNIFECLKTFSINVFLYVMKYIQMTGFNNVKTFAFTQIFYTAELTELQILQQIFIADTSNLLNHALFFSLSDISFLIMIWVDSSITQSILSKMIWRWGYSIWTIMLSVTFMSLALTLFLNQRKAARLEILSHSPFREQKPLSVLKTLWYKLDVMRLLLLFTAIFLILILLTLAATVKSEWHNLSIIVMIVIKCVCLVLISL